MMIRDKDLSLKRVLTVREVSLLTGFCQATIIKMFEGEPGVLVFSRAETLHKRKYRTFRVPQHVYERVVRRLSVK